MVDPELTRIAHDLHMQGGDAQLLAEDWLAMRENWKRLELLMDSGAMGTEDAWRVRVVMNYYG